MQTKDFIVKFEGKKYTFCVNLEAKRLDLVLVEQGGPASIISQADVPDAAQILFYKQVQKYNESKPSV